MPRYRKKNYLAIVELLGKINSVMQGAPGGSCSRAEILAECQQAAIALGNALEQRGEAGVRLTHLLEQYCENLYQLSQYLDTDTETENANRIAEDIAAQLTELAEGIRHDLPDRTEVVFLPYKAAMWDSLESVWRAADADPDCDARVVPIPYYDKEPDGSLRELHYEGALFPPEVPIIHYEDYDLKEQHPDIIYIHNPYDFANNVTTIDPDYYSTELKKYTDCLIYIPYYATSGGMSEGQALCPVYLSADYIVTQSKKFRKFFDPGLPDKKFLPYGSPKFDKVIRLCQDPPEPPEEWQAQMAGKKVYFYNTTLGEMLADTARFLGKMEYVFRCFAGRDDACLLWRPHPLLEATFDSMRKDFRPEFDRIRQMFFDQKVGIYDATPDIEKVIALCDAYVGGTGSSVASLFGIAGKPIFALNNNIHMLPVEDDWRGTILFTPPAGVHGQWVVTPGDQLYHAPQGDGEYRFCCDLSPYSWGQYFRDVWEVNGRAYVCPVNGQEILVVTEKGVTKRIPLERRLEQAGAFYASWKAGDYLFLIPILYPAIVRYDTVHDRVDYISGYNEVFAQNVRGEWHVGGSCVWRDKLILASPTDTRVLAVDVHTLEVQQLVTGAKNKCGCLTIEPEGDSLWLLPFEGTTVTRWNPLTGEAREYTDMPDGFFCRHPAHRYLCVERPFSMVAFAGGKAILSPYWANMFVSLDTETGAVEEWVPPFAVPQDPKTGYYRIEPRTVFLRCTAEQKRDTYRLFSYGDAVLYEIDLRTMEYRTLPLAFDKEDLCAHAAGFDEGAEWVQYLLVEDAFNSLPDFLDGRICGKAFDRQRQLDAYGRIAANCDGTCGEKVHRFACDRVRAMEEVE